VVAPCDSAKTIVHPGDELLGFSATFLARDTRQVVASVVPIPDAPTAPLMVAFHRLLLDGHAAAVALAQAQQQTAREGTPRWRPRPGSYAPGSYASAQG
jgi:CHAT domain-containing protein